MKERTVLASFYSESEAQQAANEIKKLYTSATVQVDELHAFSGYFPEKRSFSISGDIPSLASLSLNTTPTNRDSGILLAANPAASGMSDGQDTITGRNFLLTVICPESSVDHVVTLIRHYRGYT